MPFRFNIYNDRVTRVCKEIASCIKSNLSLAAASILILRLAPANNAALHLNAEELVAVRKEVKLRLAIVMLSACLLLFFREPIAYRVTSAILAVAVTLLISKLGFGMQ